MYRFAAIFPVLIAMQGFAMAWPSDSPPAPPGLATAAGMPDPQLHTQIARLIEQLGDEQFVARQTAERELLAIGPAAFDQIKAAENHRDPEIAARARHVARHLVIPWVRPGDPAALLEIMADYENLDEEKRNAIVLRLQYQNDPELLPALCRIARFDESSFIACHAALVIAQSTPSSDSEKAARRQILTAELGASQRLAVLWLRTYLVQLDDPETALQAWRDHTAAQRTDGGNTRHGPFLVIGLLRQQVQILDTLGRHDESLNTWFEMIDLSDDTALGLLHELVTSLLHAKRWDAIDSVIEKQGPALARDPTLLYWIAEAFMEQERQDKASEYAAQAFALPKSAQQRLQTGQRLAEQGRSAWAEREYRELISKTPAMTEASLEARTYLAALLQDDERYLDAAQLFDDLFHQINQDQDAKQMLKDFDTLFEHYRARRDYYHACHAKKEDRWQAHKEHLDRAIQHDPTDIDVLIAMYCLPDIDDTYRNATRQRIIAAAAELEQNIQTDPEMALHYNNWAWLIANTEGDIDLAVHRAQLAVQKAGSDTLAGYLDTLARCYYAKGDLTNAIKYQKQALEHDPHTKQLQRQLELFEQAATQENAIRE